MSGQRRTPQTVDLLDVGIQSRIPLKELVTQITELASLQNHGSSTTVKLLFLSARVSKMCNKSETDRRKITRALTETVAHMALSDMNVADCAQVLWSCAILGLKPKIDSRIVAKFPTATDKELCNAVWALSKWARQDTQVKEVFHQLVNSIDESRYSSFTDEDVTAITRALAVASE